MSKRFTDTEKWKDPWFFDLDHKAKLVFLYLCDNCDMAGFYERHDKSISFYTGLDVNEIKNVFNTISKSIEIKGNWIFLRNFMRHQKNIPLNPENNCHKAIIKSINDHKSLFPEVFNNTKTIPKRTSPGADKPLGRSLGKGKGSSSLLINTDFNDFWHSYPKKVGKGAAEKSWRVHVKRGNVNPSTIYMALDKQKKSEQWTKEGGQYIPYPATWLNQHRWLDETQDSTKPATDPHLEEKMKQKNEELKRLAEKDLERRRNESEDKASTNVQG